MPGVQPPFPLRVTENGRSLFVGDERAVCPCSAQNVPPTAPCHVCEQGWHSPIKTPCAVQTKITLEPPGQKNLGFFSFQGEPLEKKNQTRFRPSGKL